MSELSPLYGPEFGSYPAEDVAWLLTDLSDTDLEAAVEDREKAIQSGKAHYSESLPIEYQPDETYQALFQKALDVSSLTVAQAVGVVSERILELKGRNVVLVSLARGGTPVGVLIRRWLKEKHGINTTHYAVSILRGKGIDENALAYIAENHNPDDVIFIDGWTGKGAITKELTSSVEKFFEKTGIQFKDDIAVLADPGSCVSIFGTREDFLIPSACLNSTVSGLISRTVLNKNFIAENQFHGAKFYKHMAGADATNLFIDTIVARFDEVTDTEFHSDTTPTWEGWATIEAVNEAYGVNNMNLVKPGAGETTRVLLRRAPWRILIRQDSIDKLEHIILLAEQRGTEVEIVPELAYSCIGIIRSIKKDETEKKSESVTV